ncbi:MAG: DUF58 domain-containing protein [Bacteroidia bacterium]|nr:DUF58 domain-containing protein [Bacteroidia bacterium]
MNLLEIVETVHRIRWRLSRPVTSLLIGPYQSAFKGEGIEFSDTRPYEPGDDWRRIHWSLTARKNLPYIRLGREERELICVIAIDRSPSMQISEEKIRLTMEAAVALGLSALLNGDRVRWVTFTDRIEAFSSVCRGEKLIWGNLALLLDKPVRGRHTRLQPLLGWFSSFHRRRSFFILISDLFFQDLETTQPRLQALSLRHFVLLATPRLPQEAIDLPWGYLPTEEVEAGARAVIRSARLSSLPIKGIRTALLLPNTSTVVSLREALLPPLR